MKSLRLGRWGSLLPLHNGRQRCLPNHNIRLQSTAAAQDIPDIGSVKRKRGRPRKEDIPAALPPYLPPNATIKPSSLIPPASTPNSAFDAQPPTATIIPPKPFRTPPLSTPPTIKPSTSDLAPSPLPHGTILIPLEQLPSPPVDAAAKSAKLSALHARLSLPSRVPVETLARTLIDKTAEPDPRFNNSSLSSLGNDLLGYYMGEHLLCHYPRLPMAVLWAAQFAYVGPVALSAIAQEWGIEAAAMPGGEVNPGLLQFRSILPGTPYATRGASQAREILATRPPPPDTPSQLPLPDGQKPATTLEHAAANFIRALFAALYLHAGAAATHAFFRAHVLSRHLDLAGLFELKQPTRDLSRLCAREGFDGPVARVISETGRLSRSPVFVVGVFSGRDKLGEAAGASLNEARFKAAAAALKGWYLYSPKPVAGEVMVPSMMEGEKGKGRMWRPAHIDDGEVVV